MFDLTLSTSLTSPLAIGAPGLAPAAGDFAAALADLAMPGATAPAPAPPLSALRQSPADSGNGLPVVAGGAATADDPVLNWLAIPASGELGTAPQQPGRNDAPAKAHPMPAQPAGRSSPIDSAPLLAIVGPRTRSAPALPADEAGCPPQFAAVVSDDPSDDAAATDQAKDDKRRKKADGATAPIAGAPIVIPLALAVAADRPASGVTSHGVAAAAEAPAPNRPAAAAKRAAPPMTTSSSSQAIDDGTSAAAPVNANLAAKAGPAGAPVPAAIVPSSGAARIAPALAVPAQALPALSIAPAPIAVVQAVPGTMADAAAVSVTAPVPAPAPIHGSALTPSGVHADDAPPESVQRPMAAIAQISAAPSTPPAPNAPQAAGMVFGFALSSGLLSAQRPGSNDPSPREAALQALSAAAGSAQVASSVVAAGTAQQASLDMRRHDWPQAMIDRIEALRDAADATSTRITLVPDALGKVDVSLRHDGDAVHVHFAAEAAQTRALLADAQPRLAEAAQARGLRLGQASVDAGSSGAGRQPSQQPVPSLPLPSRPAPVAITGDDAASDSSRLA